MKLIGKSRPTRRKTCPSTTTAIINHTRKVLGSNPGLCDDRTVTVYKSNGTALELVNVISGVTRNYHRNLNSSSSTTRPLNSLLINHTVVLMSPVNPTGMFPSCHRSSDAETHDNDVAYDKDGSRLPAKRTTVITMATFNKMVVD